MDDPNYDMLILPGIGKQQDQLDISKKGQARRSNHKDRFTRVIVLAASPTNLCQPFFLMMRAEVERLIPDMDFILRLRDVDVPPISTEDRRRKYKVAADCDHILAPVLDEVHLFAVVDAGEFQFLHAPMKLGFLTLEVNNGIAKSPLKNNFEVITFAVSSCIKTLIHFQTPLG